MNFVPDLTTILQFGIATVIIAITPGPDMTLFVGRAIAEGRQAGFACMSGAMCGCLIHTTLVALGLFLATRTIWHKRTMGVVTNLAPGAAALLEAP